MLVRTVPRVARAGRVLLVDVCDMELYSAVLTTAPFILLGLSGGLVFGPAPVAARHRAWRLQLRNLLVDATAVLSVMVGALVSLLVLGDVLTATGTWRTVVLWSGGLSLVLLVLHVGGDVAMRYVESQKASESSPV